MPQLLLAFSFSGFGAVLCQIVWQRMLGIFAGSDTVSAAIVIGAFMAGLGLGAILGARVADRLSPARAVMGFALCEAGVALCALLSKPFLYDWLALTMARRVESPLAVFGLCFAGLVVPTTLMGASLPLLGRAVADSLETVAARISRLYGINTLGAGLGALLGGWLVMGQLGFVGTLGVAVTLDLAASGLALTLLCNPRAPLLAVPQSSAAAPQAWGALSFWMPLVFLSGYIVVSLEILWLRLLGQVGQYHAYLYPTVLGIFLLADGAGMSLAARLVRRLPDPRRAFFIAQVAGFAVAALLMGGLWLALARPPLSSIVSVEQRRCAPIPMLVSSLLAVLVVAPPAFLMGMTVPFVQRAVQRDLARVGARVGWVQLANIAGNAAGALLTGLITLHWLGSMGTLRLLAGLSLLLLLGWLWRSGRGRRLELFLAAACALIMVVLPSNDRFWRRMHRQAPGAFAAWGEDRSGVAFCRGPSQSAKLKHNRIFIMGHLQGCVPFQPIDMLQGVIGSLVHPAPERVLMIGVGGGGSSWGALSSPATRQVRAIEIVKPVLDMLRQIAAARPGEAVAALLEDPRLRLEVGDGRRALTRGSELYDVIAAAAVNPRTSNSGLLYSAEFFEQVKARLAPGGLYLQYAPTARIVDTFVAVFPYAVLLRPAPIILGGKDPLRFDHAQLLQQLATPAVLAHAQRGNPDVRNMTELVQGTPYLWTPATARRGASLTDMFPRDEFFVNQPTGDEAP